MSVFAEARAGWTYPAEYNRWCRAIGSDHLQITEVPTLSQRLHRALEWAAYELQDQVGRALRPR